MARKYGNKTGAYSLPTSSDATGSWISTSEVARQVGLTAWPLTLEGVPTLQVGTYVYALSSGAADTIQAGGNFYKANGQEVSRSAETELFSLIGTTYGVGDGSTTFNVPDLSNLPYRYLETTTASGSTLANLSGVAVLPSHGHNVYGTTGTTASQPTNNNGPPRTYRTAVPFTPDVGAFGSPDGNHGRHRQAKVLICKSAVTAPVGCVFPVLLPINTADFEGAIPADLLIASGQDVSREENAVLFSLYDTKFGNGDGSTTFGLPDLRGLFLRGFEDGIVASGILSPTNYISDSFARHSHTVNLLVTNQNQAQSAGGAQPNAPYLGTPATGGSNVGSGSESMPPNISVVWVLVKG